MRATPKESVAFKFHGVSVLHHRLQCIIIVLGLRRVQSDVTELN